MFQRFRRKKKKINLETEEGFTTSFDFSNITLRGLCSNSTKEKIVEKYNLSIVDINDDEEPFLGNFTPEQIENDGKLIKKFTFCQNLVENQGKKFILKKN